MSACLQRVAESAPNYSIGNPFRLVSARDQGCTLLTIKAACCHADLARPDGLPMSPSEEPSTPSEHSGSDSEWDSDSSLVKEKPEPKSKPKKEPPQFREVQFGVWTLYFPLTDSWRDYFPALESLWLYIDLIKSLPIIWRFILETLSLAPVFFAVYFVSSTLASFESAFQLFNNSQILGFTF
ncbi:hypothetical protein FS749_004254 [Ceratobasidium sp. UAMH 11750]|nr:hypothetical protein FS749_004254 [Ceratobasidium sp. UAMH 11750]